ncbi:MAG: oxygen-dependent coproporphyrinogen oxidase [Geminicoccaceae bacterium]
MSVALPITERQERARAWFEELRDRIHKALEDIEDEYTEGQGSELPFGAFERQSWQRDGGGGGVMGLMREGRVFEKAGVNISTVYGEFSDKFAAQIPGADIDPSFWASGISLVIHPRNPHVPPVHMNTRHIVTSKVWFGGGADLNPIIEYEQDTAAFHARLQATCDQFSPNYYEKFKAWADDYFWIKHRNEPRGVGGIFYDYLESGDFEADFAFTRAVGEAFLDIYPQIVRQRMHTPWDERERDLQLFRRGRYVEYNLVYDRGTRFGLETGGNPDAILMSLPPLVAWP